MNFEGKNMMPYIVSFMVILILDVESCFGEEVNTIEHNQTMRISLHYQKPAWEQQMNSPLYKYGITADWLYREKPKPPSNRTNDSIVLYRFLDNELYGKIVIGHPGQSMNVAFDANWIYTWLMSSECNDDRPDAIGCNGHNLYNHRKSSEYKPDNKTFKLGELEGNYAFENISMAHSNVTNFNFIEMTKVPDSFIFNKADGIMGLGLKVDNYNPFFYTLLDQKKIRDPIFSVYINRNRQSYRQRGGELLLGFYDKNHTKCVVIDGKKVRDKILWLPVDALSYWQFNMDKLMMIYNPKKNETFCPQGCKAVIDTSSTIITGPVADIARINKNIEARQIILQNKKRFVVDCDTVNGLPKMEFYFKDKIFTFSGPKYIVKVTNQSFSVCMSAFQYADSYDNTVRWFLGASFLSEVYTIYKPKEKTIGLVRAA